MGAIDDEWVRAILDGERTSNETESFVQVLTSNYPQSGKYENGNRRELNTDMYFTFGEMGRRTSSTQIHTRTGLGYGAECVCVFVSASCPF